MQEVGERCKMLEFVWINDRTDSLDNAVDDIESHNADKAILLVHENCARLTVDNDAPEAALQGRTFSEQALKQSRDTIASTNWTRYGQRLAATISVEHHIFWKQMDEVIQISAFARREEIFGKFVTFLARGFEPGFAGFNVALRSREDLTAVGLFLLNDFGYLVVLVVEDFA
jgi:hypothetical protein